MEEMMENFGKMQEWKTAGQLHGIHWHKPGRKLPDLLMKFGFKEWAV